MNISNCKICRFIKKSNKKVLVLLGISILFLILSLYLFIIFIKEKTSVVKDVRVANVTDTSATITWITEDATKGSIIYSDSDKWFPIINSIGKKRAYDDRDIEEIEYGKYELEKWNEDYIHHVTIRNLKPEMKYYFRISTGFKTVDEKTYYPSFETGPVIEDLRSPDPVYGLVRIEDPMNIIESSDVLIYFMVYYENSQTGITEESAFYSTISNDGSYSFDMNNIRNKFMSKLFVEQGSGNKYYENLEAYSAGYERGYLQIDSNEDQPAKTLLLIMSSNETSKLKDNIFGEVYAEETSNVSCNHANDTGNKLAEYEECCACHKKKKVVKCEGKSGYDQFHWSKCNIDSNECSDMCPSEPGKDCANGKCSNPGQQLNYCESKYCEGKNLVCKEKYCDADGCIQYKAGRYDTCTNGCEGGKCKDGDVSGGSGGTCANESAAPNQYRCQGSKCGRFDAECKWKEVAWPDVPIGECNSCRSSGSTGTPPAEQEEGDCSYGKYSEEELPSSCESLQECPRGRNCASKLIEGADELKCLSRGSFLFVYSCCPVGQIISSEGRCVEPTEEIIEDTCAKGDLCADNKGIWDCFSLGGNPIDKYYIEKHEGITPVCRIVFETKQTTDCLAESKECVCHTAWGCDSPNKDEGCNSLCNSSTPVDATHTQECICNEKTTLGWGEAVNLSGSNNGINCGTSKEYISGSTKWVVACEGDSGDPSQNKWNITSTDEDNPEIGVQQDYEQLEQDAKSEDPCPKSNMGWETPLGNVTCIKYETQLKIHEGKCKVYCHQYWRSKIPGCGKISPGDTSFYLKIVHDGECSSQSSLDNDFEKFSVVQKVNAEENSSELKVNRSGIYEIQGATLTSGSNEITIYLDEEQGELSLKFFNDTNKNGKRDEGEDFINTGGISLNKKQDLVVYDFKQGWNLVSFPIVSDEIKTAKGLIDRINNSDGYATHIASYRNGKWVLYSQRQNLSFSDDFNILPGVGYFIKIAKETSIIIKGNRFAESLPIDMEVGWNLVGIVSPGKEYTAGSLIDGIVVDEIGADTVTKWDNGIYENYIKEGGLSYGQDYRIFEIGGYFIRVKEKGGNFQP